MGKGNSVVGYLLSVRHCDEVRRSSLYLLKKLSVNNCLISPEGEFLICVSGYLHDGQKPIGFNDAEM